MNFKRRLRRFFRKIKRKVLEKYPKRNKHEKNLIKEFMDKRIQEASEKGWEYALFPCTINGGEIIYDDVQNKEIHLQLHDFEWYSEKHNLQIRYVDDEYYRTKRNLVQNLEILF